MTSVHPDDRRTGPPKARTYAELDPAEQAAADAVYVRLYVRMLEIADRMDVEVAAAEDTARPDRGGAR